MDRLERLQERIAKEGVPEKREGHLAEVLASIKSKTENVERFYCMYWAGSLICCVEAHGERYCWTEWVTV